MEAVTIIGAIAAIAIVVAISFVVDRYSWGTYDYRPFNPKTIWVSFVCGLPIAVGVYLWWRAGFTGSTLAVLGCGISVYVGQYVGLLVYVARRSNRLIAIWTVTILSALFPVVAPLSAVWSILKPKQRSSESRTRLSDTTDEDDKGGRRAGASRPLREPVVRYRTRRWPGARRARAVPGSAWRDPNPPPPWTVADRVWLHEDQRRRGIDEPDGWVVRELPHGADVCAGPRARDALRLARDLRGHSPLSQRDDAKLFAWPVTAAELDALAKHLPSSALGIVEGAVPWWREPDR